MEPTDSMFKENYDFIVRFLYHEYLASIATFQGLAQLAKKNKDPYLKYYVMELEKFKARVKEIEKRFIIIDEEKDKN